MAGKNHVKLDYYYSLCTCTWFYDAGPHPMAARKRAITHAKRNPGHRSCVVNWSRVSVVWVWRFDALTSDDVPPY